jgi:hypothetical protein
VRFLPDKYLLEIKAICTYPDRLLTAFILFSSSAGADKQDFYEQIPIILRELLYRLNDEDATVLKATNGALVALSKHVPAEELVKHIEFIRNLISSTVSDARRRKGGVGDGIFLMPGFNIPKGKQSPPGTKLTSNVMRMHFMLQPDPSVWVYD